MPVTCIGEHLEARAFCSGTWPPMAEKSGSFWSNARGQSTKADPGAFQEVRSGRVKGRRQRRVVRWRRRSGPSLLIARQVERYRNAAAGGGFISSLVMLTRCSWGTASMKLTQRVGSRDPRWSTCRCTLVSALCFEEMDAGVVHGVERRGHQSRRRASATANPARARTGPPLIAEDVSHVRQALRLPRVPAQRRMAAPRGRSPLRGRTLRPEAIIPSGDHPGLGTPFGGRPHNCTGLPHRRDCRDLHPAQTR
jgi:hypothetical protein